LGLADMATRSPWRPDVVWLDTGVSDTATLSRYNAAMRTERVAPA